MNTISLRAALAVFSTFAGVAQAQSCVVLDPLPGGTSYSEGLGVVSPEAGQYRVVGVSDSVSSLIGERWYHDVSTGLTGVSSVGFVSPGIPFSKAEAASASGAVIVGTSSYSGTRTAGFRWTQSSGIVQIGPVGTGSGAIARLHGCSADGNVMVGESTTGTQSILIPHR